MKLGYKQTDVGLIPEGWELGDLHRSMTYTHGKAHEPFVAEWGKYTIVNSKFIATEGAVKKVVTSNFCPAQQGDVLMVLSDLPNGRALAKTYTAGSEASMLAVNQRVVRLRPNPKQCDGSYAGYAINRHPYFLKFDDGVTQTHLLNKHLDEFKFPLPPIKEQRAIAQVLSDVDAEIESLSQRHEKLIAQKQGLSEELLSGRTRLVEPKSKGFKQTDVGVIPEEWEVKSLVDIVDGDRSLFDDGDWIESEFIIDEGIRLVQTGNIGVGRFIEKDIKRFISQESFEFLKCKRLCHGDILICRLAEPAGRACVFQLELSQDCVTSVDVTIFRPSVDLVSREFLSQFFSSPVWLHAVSENAGGTTHKRISRGSLGRLCAPLPSLKEQQAIAEVLSDVDAEIQAVAKLKAKVQAKKEGLMQTLLTGKIRLT